MIGKTDWRNIINGLEIPTVSYSGRLWWGLMTARGCAASQPVTDGEYHVYDLGVYDLPHSQIYAWVGTTTGDMYVDRFLFVREP